MRIRFKHVIGLSILLLLLTFSLGAQPLPSLPAASGVVTGTLPNGISYFLVSNPSSKGRADFALVQKGPAREDVSRNALAELPTSKVKDLTNSLPNSASDTKILDLSALQRPPRRFFSMMYRSVRPL